MEDDNTDSWTDVITTVMNEYGHCYLMDSGKTITHPNYLIAEYRDGHEERCCFDNYFCEMPKDASFPCLTSRIRYMDDMEELENLKREEPEFCEGLKQDFNEYLLNI